MPKSKERKKHLLFAILFFAVAIWMLFYYLYPIFFFGEPKYHDTSPVNFEDYRIENIILTVIIPFIVFITSIVFINFHLMECDYFCEHDGWWGLFIVLAWLFILGGIFVFLSPLTFIILNSCNWFFMFISLEIIGVDIFVLWCIAKKRRRILGVTNAI